MAPPSSFSFNYFSFFSIEEKGTLPLFSFSSKNKNSLITTPLSSLFFLSKKTDQQNKTTFFSFFKTEAVAPVKSFSLAFIASNRSLGDAWQPGEELLSREGQQL